MQGHSCLVADRQHRFARLVAAAPCGERRR